MKKKLVISFIALFVVIVINFLIPIAMEGDPVLMLLGIEEAEINLETYQYYYQEMNLHKPLPVRFFHYFFDTITGDFGYSFHFDQEISSLISSRIPNTLQIAIPAILLSSILSIVLGIPMGMRKGKTLDRTTSLSMIVVDAIPAFLLGLMLILLFASKLQWFPYGSLNSTIPPTGFFPLLLDRLHHLFLPILTLTLASLPSKYLIVRNMTANLRCEKYIIYARARGLSTSRIYYSHILKNIAQPFVTVVGLHVGIILSGTLVIETIFSIKGMGSLISDAISFRDFRVLQSCLYVSALTVVIANLITDIVCKLLNPKVRLGVYDET